MIQSYKLTRNFIYAALLAVGLTSCGSGGNDTPNASSDSVNDGTAAVSTDGENVENTNVSGDGVNETSGNENELDNGTVSVGDSIDSGGEEPGTDALMASDSGSSAGNEIDEIGVILVQHTSLPASTTTRATANFYRLDSPVPADFPLEIFPQQDSCSPGAAEAIALPGLESLGSDFTQATSLSAGEVITIMSQIGSYASLIPEAVVVDEDIDYENDDIGESPFGLELNMSIPGDEFPAVNSLSLPPQFPFDSTLKSQLLDLNSNPNLRWSVNASDEETVGLIALIAAFTSPDSVIPTTISCIVLDDGEFTVPDSVLDGLNENAMPVVTSVLHAKFSRQVVNGLGFLFIQLHAQ